MDAECATPVAPSARRRCCRSLAANEVPEPVKSDREGLSLTERRSWPANSGLNHLPIMTRLVCQNQRMLDHLSIQCADLEKSAAFYSAVLATIGGELIMEHGEVLGFGVPPMPDFWLGKHETGEGFRESHIAFTAPDRDSVQAFFDAAVSAGAEVLHPPRVWPEYHPNYFGGFVRDPDGNNVEAVCHSPA
jgi:catechol 2,3-dioxygenase-like lactoylglutathione lyase family enzyme